MPVSSVGPITTRAGSGQDAGNDAGAAERLDAVVLSIARLIGRRMVREDFTARIAAANDNDAPRKKKDHNASRAFPSTPDIVSTPLIPIAWPRLPVSTS